MGGRRNAQGGDIETHKGGTEKHTIFGTDGQTHRQTHRNTDRHTQVHIEVVPTLKDEASGFYSGKLSKNYSFHYLENGVYNFVRLPRLNS